MENEQTNFEIQQINFEIVNLINAMLQGQFAANNILSQVKHPSFQAETLSKLKSQIKDSQEFFTLLEDGGILVDLESEEATEGETQLFTILASLQNTYAAAANEIITLTQNQNLAFEEENMQLLVAYFGWYAYSQDNYYKQLKKFSEKHNRSEYLMFVEQNLQKTKNEVAITGSLLKSLKDVTEDRTILSQKLLYHCRAIAGLFLSKIHDTNQFINLRSEFTFEMAHFTPEEQAEWESLQFSPIEAGYWRAYGFTPPEAGNWNSIGFYSAADAADWRYGGFTHNQAASWARYAFTPLLALNWQAANINPEHATILINKGYALPDALPDDPVEIQEIIKAAKIENDEQAGSE